MTEPGWYTDPRDSSQYRYWDGSAWTEAVAPGAAAETYADAVEDEDAETAASAAEPVAETAPGHLDSASDDIAGEVDAATEVVGDHAGDLDSASDDIGGQLDGEAQTVTQQLADVFPDRVGGEGDHSSGMSVDEALLGIDAVDTTAASEVGYEPPPLDASNLDAPDLSAPDISSGVPSGLGVDVADSVEGFSQGVSVDEVLGEVTDPLDEAFEAASAKTSDLADGGIPGDGVSFTSPIDGFGPADQTAVIPGPGSPYGAQEGPGDGPTGSDPAGQGGGFAPPPPPGGPGSFTDRVPDPVVEPGPGVDNQPDTFGSPQPGFGTPPPDFGPGGGAAGGPDGGFDQPPPDGGFGAGQFPDDVATTGGPRPVSPPVAVPSKSKTPWIILGVIGLAVVATLLFLAIRAPNSTSVDSISIGQCFADFDQFDATEIRSSVSSADCDEAHALEVFEVTDDPYRDFGEYPGEEVIKDLAFRHCLDGFEGFVGTAYGDSALDVWALYPTEGSWTLNGDREVVCMVGAFDKSLTVGTLSGSGR